MRGRHRDVRMWKVEEREREREMERGIEAIWKREETIERMRKHNEERDEERERRGEERREVGEK